MVTVNGTLLKNRFADGDISVTEAEYSLDGAIDLLNTFDAGLTELSGAAGSRTGTYTSKEAGAIIQMALQVYRKNFKNADGANVTVSSLGITYSNDNQLLSFARQLALQLSGRSLERA